MSRPVYSPVLSGINRALRPVSSARRANQSSCSKGGPVPDRRRKLLWHGAFLFLLGLLTGLVQQEFRNPRMGLAAHLEGLMNGTFLLAIGAAWGEVKLRPKLTSLAYWTALYGTYANWTFTTIAAIFGTVAMTPLASAGHTAQGWQEGVVAFGFVSVAVAMLVAVVLLLVGYRRVQPA
jgi:hydroxylaminobenzene mutase